MDWIHLHLALNHLPVVGLPLAGLLLAVAVLRGERWWIRAALVAVVVLVVAGMGVKFSGDEAAPLTRALPGATAWYDDSLVNRHEQAADRAATGLFLMGLAAVAGLVASRRDRPVPRWSLVAVLLTGTATLVLLVVTANSGGQIRHPEIRPGAERSGR